MAANKCPLCGERIVGGVCSSCGYEIPDEASVAAPYNYDPSDYELERQRYGDAPVKEYEPAPEIKVAVKQDDGEIYPAPKQAQNANPYAGFDPVQNAQRKNPYANTPPANPYANPNPPMSPYANQNPPAKANPYANPYAGANRNRNQNPYQNFDPTKGGAAGAAGGKLTSSVTASIIAGAAASMISPMFGILFVAHFIKRLARTKDTQYLKALAIMMAVLVGSGVLRGAFAAIMSVLAAIF